jgi:hypothetical protein
MKKIIFTLMLILPLSTIFAQDEDESKDYNWTLFTDASKLSADYEDDKLSGNISIGALYNISEKFQAGASLSTGFGDEKSDAAISISARFFVSNNIYLLGSLPVTDEAGEGFNIGIGNRFKLGDRVEFLPGLDYNTDSDLITISTGFAVKL